MKEVKSKDTKTGKSSIIWLANQSEYRTYYFSAELKAKQETIQSKKVEDALKRPRAVLDAETQKILHSFLQGEYCLSFGFYSRRYNFERLLGWFSSHNARKPSHFVHVVGSRATNPNLEEELVGGNMNSVMASMSCNIMSGPQVSYQLHFLRHASYVPGIRQ